MKFLDEAKIHIQSGHGGRGCVSFRREKFIPMGGPDGGDGGRGGDILFVADENLTTLWDFRYKRAYEAQSGKPGSGNNRTGASAPPLVIRVPMGTLIRDQHTGEVLADLTKDHQEYIALQGGRGGKGNSFFKRATQQAPQKAQPGEPGEEKDVLLELKLLADVGIIGLPNAGKSTLLSQVSHAKPKIADYPFTTLSPNLGVVEKGKDCFVAADIPGLVEGAHKGKGLGIQFLKHIERTKLFLHLIDASQEDPIMAFESINEELKQYSPSLFKKKQIIVLNKIDLLSKKELYSLVKKFKDHIRHKNVSPRAKNLERGNIFVSIICISALKVTGISKLVEKIFEEL